MLPHPFREVTVERDKGGRPGFREGAPRRLQLRDSAGLEPASPLCPGFRAEGHLCRVSVCWRQILWDGTGKATRFL